jgi:hypothetical protein
MAYQVAKEIGRQISALSGKADCVCLCGVATSISPLVQGIEDRTKKWARLVVLRDDLALRALELEGRKGYQRSRRNDTKSKESSQLPDVTVFYGLYGSGKTEISINYALRLREQGMDVTIVDLDAVTPYFRVRDVRDHLVSQGIVVVAPKESVRHADLPVLPEGVRTALGREEGAVVIDVGGDPTGARVLGGLSDALSKEAKGYFVVNSRRPFTRTVEDAAKAVEKISASAGLTATGLVATPT